MKRMLLTLELMIDEESEIDYEALDELLEAQGFVSTVENDEGSLTLLPQGTYFGEFSDATSANALIDKVEQVLADNEFDTNALLVTEMGADMVLIGEELTDEEEEPEAKA